ncbi:MAG: thiamine pyrophosphate-dependent enzyme [Acidimicrobiales bacterium]|jgi:acetolactate synthase-1/2/3 large subunit|nr:thiamine pyrophosphate-dependent enzyme [Acidimicrobiales bacterium]|tara:strand:+ start:11390 stop:13051 length:1662 start_codon:yes stop_codon:yes gene_type:complete
MAMMTGGQAVAETLALLGVSKVFGIVSVHNLPIYDAISLHPDIQVINVRHEQAAAHAADAYSRVTGELGVILTSTGPGALNAVAGIYEAAFVSSKLLMVTGQIESRFRGKGKGFLHEYEKQPELLSNLCRTVSSVRYAEDISRDMAAVADDIQRGRPQPGAIEIPIDLQYQSADIDLFASRTISRLVPDKALLNQALALLENAQRPLIWAGGGVNISGASGELTDLAERMGAPVVTTIEGRGAISEAHDLSLGFRTDRRSAAEIFEEADVVLAIGTRFQNYATRVWTLQMPENLIHIDVDPGVIGRNYPAAVPIVADAKMALQELLQGLGKTAVDEQFLERCRKIKEADEEAIKEEIGPDHSEIVSVIRRLLPEECPVVRDSTVPNYTWGNRLLKILRSRTSIRPAAVAIGPGLPLAMGAAIGSMSHALLVQGDGGLQLSIGELSACAEHQIPVIALVFNDSGYNVLRIIQENVLGHKHGTELSKINFVTVAQGMGVEAERVEGIEQFEPALARALARSGPSVIEIDMDFLSPIELPLPAHQRARRETDTSED